MFNQRPTVTKDEYEIKLNLHIWENQVTISQDLVARDAPVSNLINSLNVLKSIHQQLIDAFSQSSAARVAMFKIFGDKMQMEGILTYSKNVIYHLNAIIQNR